MFQDIASAWESELDPADTDTYMSPKEGSDSPHLIDLTLSREVTAFDLAIHAGVWIEGRVHREVHSEMCYEYILCVKHFKSCL